MSFARVRFHMKKRKVKVLVTQSCPNLYGSMDCSLPGSSVHGILQARILEWVAISFSRGSSQPRDWTQVSCIAGRFLTIWAAGRLYLIHMLPVFDSFTSDSPVFDLPLDHHPAPWSYILNSLVAFLPLSILNTIFLRVSSLLGNLSYSSVFNISKRLLFQLSHFLWATD